jgi:hypothetical protein
MTFWVAGAVVGSSLIGARAAGKAADTQAGAMDRSAELQYQQYQDTVARQKPFYDVGVNALPELVEASRYQPFTMDKFQADPGYAFRLSEGQKPWNGLLRPVVACCLAVLARRYNGLAKRWVAKNTPTHSTAIKPSAPLV